jgi:hypothetical protein
MEDEVAMANFKIGSDPFGHMGPAHQEVTVKATAQNPDEA